MIEHVAVQAASGSGGGRMNDQHERWGCDRDEMAAVACSSECGQHHRAQTRSPYVMDFLVLRPILQSD